ncbi:MAG: STAS/SEC14 domain-containing protein [Polyangiales bacterium]
MKPSSNKSSGIFTGDALGNVGVAMARENVLEIRYERYTSRATAMRGFERAGELLRQNPQSNALVLGLLDATGHDPGNTALGVRWSAEFRDQLRRVAFVTRSQSLANLGNIVKVMVPWIEVRVFTSRDDAIAWCELPLPQKTSSQTGVRPVTGRRNSAA